MSVTFPTSWMGDDNETIYAGDLTIRDDGTTELKNKRENRLGQPSVNGRATSGQCSRPIEKAPCSKCGSARTITISWGFLIFGTPWWVKVFGRTPQDGCGCFVLPKLLWEHFTKGIAAYRKLRADTMRLRQRKGLRR